MKIDLGEQKRVQELFESTTTPFEERVGLIVPRTGSRPVRSKYDQVAHA